MVVALLKLEPPALAAESLGEVVESIDVFVDVSGATVVVSAEEPGDVTG